jgi:anti-sigma factor (TIGR02949 family)
MTKPVKVDLALQSCEQTPMKEKCEHHNDCMKLIQMVLDGEATPDQIQHVSQNLGKCLPCQKGYQLEKAVKEALQLRIERKAVPESLAESIRQRINL